ACSRCQAAQFRGRRAFGALLGPSSRMRLLDSRPLRRSGSWRGWVVERLPKIIDAEREREGDVSPMIPEPSGYEGGCHCGAVRFRVRVDGHQAKECNCSICAKKGFIHLIVTHEQFTLLSGADALTTYTFNTGVAKHTFCRICGVHSFYTPRSHPD